MNAIHWIYIYILDLHLYIGMPFIPNQPNLRNNISNRNIEDESTIFIDIQKNAVFKLFFFSIELRFHTSHYRLKRHSCSRNDGRLFKFVISLFLFAGNSISRKSIFMTWFYMQLYMYLYGQQLTKNHDLNFFDEVLIHYF